VTTKYSRTKFFPSVVLECLIPRYCAKHYLILYYCEVKPCGFNCSLFNSFLLYIDRS